MFTLFAAKLSVDCFGTCGTSCVRKRSHWMCKSTVKSRRMFVAVDRETSVFVQGRMRTCTMCLSRPQASPGLCAREGAPLSWRPSAVADAGNGAPLTWRPSAHTVAGRTDTHGQHFGRG